MRSFSVGLVVVTALVCLTPEKVFAQQDTAAGPRFREAFASLPEGRTVKVLRSSGTTVGQYGGIVGDSLALRTSDGPPVTLALDDVEAAWSRKHKAGKGALVGGIVGVVLGGLLGAAAQSFCTGLSDGGDCGSVSGNIVVGALGGGAIGAGVGALIGAVIPGWKPLAPAEGR